MPRGDKSAYTAKQKRQARDIEKGYESKGLSAEVAAARALATVNKLSGGGKLSGSGRKPRKPVTKAITKRAASRKTRTR
jgi:hypothetical protein